MQKVSRSLIVLRHQLQQAVTDQDYRLFNTASFILSEAIELWSENDKAKTALRNVQVEHARCALNKGDLDLCQELIDQSQTEDHKLISKLFAALRSRKLQARRTKRLKVVLVALVCALLGTCTYVVIEYLKFFGDWSTIVEVDFHKDLITSNDRSHFAGITFKDPALQTIVPTPPVDEGLTLSEGTWAWFDDVSIRGHCRITLELEIPINDAVEICLGTRNEPVLEFSDMPAGYWAILSPTLTKIAAYPDQRVGAYTDSERAIQLTGTQGIVRSEQRHQLRIERRGTQIDMFVDGKLALRRDFVLPLSGDGYTGFGIRAWQGTAFYSCQVERLTLPQRTSPIVAGDSLVRHGQLPLALNEYLTLANDFEGTDIEAESLAKGVLTWAKLNKPDLRQTIYNRFTSLENTAWSMAIYKAQALDHWQAERFAAALRLVESILAYDPGDIILFDILNTKRKGLPKDIALACATLLIQHCYGTSLDLSHLGLDALPLAIPAQVTSLDISHNQFAVAPDIAHLQLQRLLCQGNQLSSLKFVAEQPLIEINFSHNEIENIDHLRGLPLKKITGEHNQIAHLNALIDHTT